MRRAVLLAGLGFALVLASGARGADTYLEQVAQAERRAEQGQWDQAAQAFEAAARLDPEDGLAYAGQGLCQLAARQVEAAAALFRRAAADRQCAAVAGTGLGLCYLQNGQLTLAEQHLQQAAEQDHAIFAPVFYLAVLDVCHGRADQAEERLAQARDLGAPDLALDYLDVLRLYAAGRWQPAQEAVRRLKPKLATVLPGLPLPLPLRMSGAPGQAATFSVPEHTALSERIAPPAAAPVAETVGEPVRVGPLTLEQPRPNQVVSGRLPIRVELREARDFRYVGISVDGQLKGMTNREPFYVAWDTTQVPDGPHQVTARAFGDSEVEVSTQVTVRNTAPTGPLSTHDPAGWRTAAHQLASLMLHGHPPSTMENLLLESTRQQDPEQAMELYERLLAGDATRTDVIEPLLALYRAQRLAVPAGQLPEPQHGVAGGRRVALTFDDGPRPEYTPQLLALLRKWHARGTFMVVGRMAEKYPELVKAIAADGHEIGSHTYNHLHLDQLRPNEIVYEMVKTKVVLDEILGGSSRIFRPPGGHYSATVRDTVASLGYVPIFWTINGASFSRQSPMDAADNIARLTGDGGILLLHNGGDNTLPLLPYLLDNLHRAGYHFVTVSDILRAPTDPVAATRPTGAAPPIPTETSEGE